MFKFLWVGNDMGGKMDLVNQEILSKPKNVGGWDIKSLHFFNMALSMKSMWRVLFGKGLWNDVLHGKSMKGNIIKWIQNLFKSVRNVSKFWSGFFKSFSWISGGFSWKVGDGSIVLVGIQYVIAN